MRNFADRLIELIDTLENPSCVGLDPRIADIPELIKAEAVALHGNTLESIAKAFFEFNKRLVDATYDIIPAYKLQIAFYEAYGVHGFEALEMTVSHIKRRRRLVILDAKRGDIGSTARAYADAYLGSVELCDRSKAPPPIAADAMTVNPYFGYDGIKPFLEACRHGRGVFIVVKTSNPSSKEFQNLRLADGSEFYEAVARKVAEWGAQFVGSSGYSAVGMVIGATFPAEAKRCREIARNAIALVPGYGYQGGRAEDIIPLFNDDGLGAIINSSRGIIFAYKDERFKAESFEASARRAAIAMREDIVAALRDAGICRW
ncbi:MAG TPA: orotidine-5'-phosphate decarboxylase [Methanomicrobia archaeon]|nr:Orotidine-5'-phosphate decarboxylase [Candidatus Alkanophaga volatiphilum]HDO63932.1 orotidine-5'-phosphate decarboxylase [Methanomicrobia archaeon]HEX59525.1 orotidine-5'-phosphate decarboxylase [Methanomicrobia archaeon]